MTMHSYIILLNTPKEAIRNKIPPLQVFTNFLLDYQPAGVCIDTYRINFVINNWHERCKKPCISLAYDVNDVDPIFHAVHRDAVETILPYIEKFEKSC